MDTRTKPIIQMPFCCRNPAARHYGLDALNVLPITSYYPRSRSLPTTPAARGTPHSWLSNCLVTFRACKLSSGRVSLAEWKHTWACPDLLAWLHLDCSGPLSPLAGGPRRALGPEYALVCVIQRVPCSGTRTALCSECRISTDITGTSSATWHYR